MRTQQSPAAGTEGTPEKPFGESPFKGKTPTSIVDQLDRKIETIPHDQVQATYDAALKAIEENKGAPGAALKAIGRTLFSLIK